MQRNTPISDVMTRDPKVVAPDHKISEIRELLTNSRIHHLPVVEGTKLVGIISSNDLLMLSASMDDADASMNALLDTVYELTDIMEKDVVTVPHTGTVADAASALSAGGFHSVPVVDAAGNLVGIVTSTDLINYLLESLWPTTKPRPTPQRHDEPTLTPGESELRMALEAAERMHETGQDPEFIAATLLYFRGRSKRLEQVYKAAALYLRSGLAEREHTALVRALENAQHGSFGSRAVD